MNKHTPGPWKVFENSFALGIISMTDGDGADVAYCPSVDANSERPRDEDRANARLIAAAPALYASLKECLPFLGWSDMDEDELIREVHLGNETARFILRARVALAQAENPT